MLYSVHWKVQELVSEYGAIIDKHVLSLLGIIASHHWRLNPNVLAGSKIAVFRKTSGSIPTMITGWVA